jgi:RNase H-fold protein (predicted Holliday junction resolvase)
MKKTITTVGISLGTRSIGIALLQGNQLLEWKVRSFTGKWSKIKRSLIVGTIKKYLIEYSPDRIALKTPAEGKPSRQVRKLLSILVKLCSRQQMPFYCYTLSDLKECFGCKTKSELITIIGNHFPELVFTNRKVKQFGSGYYNKLFEAIACAMLCASVSQK